MLRMVMEMRQIQEANDLESEATVAIRIEGQVPILEVFLNDDTIDPTQYDLPKTLIDGKVVKEYFREKARELWAVELNGEFEGVGEGNQITFTGTMRTDHDQEGPNDFHAKVTLFFGEGSYEETA